MEAHLGSDGPIKVFAINPKARTIAERIISIPSVRGMDDMDRVDNSELLALLDDAERYDTKPIEHPDHQDHYLAIPHPRRSSGQLLLWSMKGVKDLWGNEPAVVLVIRKARAFSVEMPLDELRNLVQFSHEQRHPR